MEKLAFKPVFLVPYYNHPAKIADLVENLSKMGEILIIDDGSDEVSKNALIGLKAEIFTRENNGGKGAALKDGFKIALQKGYTHAFQIDADFQHDISKCDDFLQIAQINPHSLICANPIYDENAPKSRFYGRKITNFWCAINSLSSDIKDGMCGFRIYPLKEICEILPSVKNDRMGFDIEILVLACRAKIPLKWIELKVCYEKGGVSHFRMFRDNFQISLTHARLFFTLPLWLAKRAFHG
ncbi:MAG: glycosyltransferase family 2 protein [Campylobacter sp.]|nr:glycosyltransferase family 2 protein [Campylobacter sp.]